MKPFAHSCRNCGYPWFTYHHDARCPKCGSAKRETFKLVPYAPEPKLRREIIIYFVLLAIFGIGILLVRLIY